MIMYRFANINAYGTIYFQFFMFKNKVNVTTESLLSLYCDKRVKIFIFT